MKLDHFIQVIEIANTKSFSQAARNLYISQPNLSYSIKQLETEIGHPLFIRQSDGVTITSYGKDFLMHASIILKEFEILQNLSENKKSKDRLSLNIATLNVNRTAKAFSKLIENHKDQSIDFSLLHYLSIDEIEEQLTTYQADVAIISILSPYYKSTIRKLKNAKIEYTKISSTPISAVVGKKNPLFHHPSGVIELKDLSNFPMILYGSEYDAPSFSLTHSLEINNEVPSIIHVNNNKLLYSTIENTNFFGLLAYEYQTFNNKPENKKLRALKLTDYPIDVEYGFIKSEKQNLSDLALEFIELSKALF